MEADPKTGLRRSRVYALKKDISVPIAGENHIFKPPHQVLYSGMQNGKHRFALFDTDLGDGKPVEIFLTDEEALEYIDIPK